MNTLIALVGCVVPEHMAWHEQYQLAVLRKWDGSWWVRWVVDAVLYEWSAQDSAEVVAIIGESIAADVGWRLL